MALASACDVCGFRPRDKDCAVIEITHDKKDVDILHVICYECNHEWVE